MGSERGSSSGPGGCIPADRHHTEAWAVLSWSPYASIGKQVRQNRTFLV